MTNLLSIRERFFNILQRLIEAPMFINLVPFIQGEDAFLLAVFDNKKLTPTELSIKLKITKGRVTALINSLSRKEYIEIESDKNDRRRIQITLSPTGFDYLTQKITYTEEHFIELFKNLGEFDSQTFVDLLEKVITIAKGL